jgi:transposase
MAMGRRPKERQGQMWVEVKRMSKGPGHPSYGRLDQVLAKGGFDVHVEEVCKRFYAKTMGRPSLPPSVYFRLMLIGYFEGIDSERGIAWRVADSLTLREFLGYEPTDTPPDHSTISRNRRLLDLPTHQEVFTWVLGLLAQEGLLRGKTLGIDGTTLEANAALRSIVRRDTGEGYEEFWSVWRRPPGSRRRRARIWRAWTANGPRRGRIKSGSIPRIRTRRSPR